MFYVFYRNLFDPNEYFAGFETLETARAFASSVVIEGGWAEIVDEDENTYTVSIND